jgi:GH25 family lysozyme M1 (1,4-beta-N-acetylmuramidase)
MSYVNPLYEVGGVDLSHWQSPIDFKVLAPKIQFAILRCSHGLQEDKSFDTYVRELRARRIPFGVYHYWYPAMDSLLQAQVTLDAINGSGGGWPELGVFIDLEERPSYTLAPNLKNYCTERVVQYIMKVEKGIQSLYNKYVGVYSTQSYWSTYIDYTRIGRMTERTPWIAQWPNNPPFIKPTASLQGFPRMRLWQFSATGGVPTGTPPNGKDWGVYSRGLDLDVYLGTQSEFEGWFHVNLQTRPPVPETLPEAIKPLRTGIALRPKPTEMSYPVLANTQNYAIEVMSSAVDEKGRTWYQVGKSLWIPAWEGTPVNK